MLRTAHGIKLVAEAPAIFKDSKSQNKKARSSWPPLLRDASLGCIVKVEIHVRMGNSTLTPGPVDRLCFVGGTPALEFWPYVWQHP